MTRPSVPAATDTEPVIDTEKRQLQPNDALILMHFARHPKSEPAQQAKLSALLSEEGRLIAQVLLGRGDASTMPASVVTTAQALRRWAEEPTRKHERTRIVGSVNSSAEATGDSEAPTRSIGNMDPILSATV